MHSTQRGKRRIKRRKISKHILTIVIAGTLLGLIINGIYEDFSLRNNHELTTGVITDYRYSMNGVKVSFYFEYEVNGKKYKSSYTHSNMAPGDAEYFIGKQFPVAYKKNDVDKCRMLMTRLNFRQFNIAFPDSLKWVRRYESSD